MIFETVNIKPKRIACYYLLSDGILKMLGFEFPEDIDHFEFTKEDISYEQMCAENETLE